MSQYQHLVTQTSLLLTHIKSIDGFYVNSASGWPVRSASPRPRRNAGARTRTPCFGRCPAYRLSLTADGRVQFASHNAHDTARTAQDSISPAAIATLVAEASRLGVFDLPPRIAVDRSLCPDRAADHPTAIVGFYWPGRLQQIVDDHGCFLAPDHSVVDRVANLRRFENMIDSVAQSQRWVRLNGVPVPPDLARLTGSMLRIEPLGVELTLPPAWFGARDSTMPPTCGSIIRGTPDHRFVTARPMLDSLRNADGQWDREYSSVVDSILPFGDLVAQVGPEPFGRKLGADCFDDLQMRVYVLPTAHAWDDSVRTAPLARGLTTARRFFASAVLASTDSLRWHVDWLHWNARYTDYGAEANVQLYSTTVQDRTLVLVFMRAAWDRGAEDQQRFILQHLRFF